MESTFPAAFRVLYRLLRSPIASLNNNRIERPLYVPTASSRCIFAVKRSLTNRCLVAMGYSTLARRSSLMTQFQRIKAQYPDHLLLFQVGDFYELYGEDASEASSKTSLRLTKKGGVLMAGFPVHSLDEWQRILIEAGLQLAICNQQSTRKDQVSPTLLEREVIRLVTPGTLTEPLDHASSNYLMAISPGPTSAVGLAWTDVSTSEFMVSSVDVTELDDDLERIAPSEVLLPKHTYEILLSNPRMGLSHSRMSEGIEQSSQLRECHITPVPVEWYRREGEMEKGQNNYGDETHYDNTNLKNSFEAVANDGRYSQQERSAAYALLRYISHTHRELIPHLLPPSPFTHSHHLAIDTNTRRALELVTPLQGNPKKTTLLGSIDRTVTSAGARLFRTRLTSPLTDIPTINNYFPLHRDTIRVQLRTCGDMERVMQKVATMSCGAADLKAIKTSISTARSILQYLTEVVKPDLSPPEILAEERQGLRGGELSELEEELERAVCGQYITHYHYISTGYSEEVDNLRREMRENEAAVERLATSLQERTGVAKLSVVSYKMYGRVLEVSRAQSVRLDQYPQLIRIDHTQSKARYTHVELQALNAGLHCLETHYSQIQDHLFQLLCNKIMTKVEDIIATARALARLDVATSLGLLAEEKVYTKPILVAEPIFEVEGGLHPVLSSPSSSSSSSHHFVSNDCILDPHRLWVITGPNMGGKSTFLRQNSLLLVMAQMGSFVPARVAKMGVADRLFARVGAGDNISKHMSTFHVEMSQTANILAMATRHSFVVLDEIGRGTSSNEGMAIAEAVIEHLSSSIGCRCLVATHYHKLAATDRERVREEGLGPTVGFYKLEAEIDSYGNLTFTYKFKAGRAEHSFGIEVARLAGLPPEVIHRSKELFEEMEVDHN